MEYDTILTFHDCVKKKLMCKTLLGEYVALSDPGSIKCSYILEQSPRDWEKTMRQNVVLTFFHKQNICHCAWKTLTTTL